jgi:hypothetical protein
VGLIEMKKSLLDKMDVLDKKVEDIQLTPNELNLKHVEC